MSIGRAKFVEKLGNGFDGVLGAAESGMKGALAKSRQMRYNTHKPLTSKEPHSAARSEPGKVEARWVSSAVVGL